jgi:hypothetical protein
MPRTDRESGLTVVEMAVSILVISVTAGIVTMSFGTSYGLWRSGSSARHLDRKSNRGLSKVIEVLQYADVSKLEPVLLPGETSSYVSFQRSTGFVDGEQQWGQRIRIEWRSDPDDPVDAVDNNGNGLVDEGMVVRIVDPGGADEQSTVLVHGVSNLFKGEAENGKDDNGNGLIDEKGLCFEREANILTVRVTMLGSREDGAVNRWTGEGTIALLGD